METLLNYILSFFRPSSFIPIAVFVIHYWILYHLIHFFRKKGILTLSYKLFLVASVSLVFSGFCSLISSGENPSFIPTLFAPKLTDLILYFGLGNSTTFFLLYGIIALIIEKSDQKWFRSSLLKMFLLTLFSFGTYLPIWIMQKYKEYEIEAKYHKYLIIYIFVLVFYLAFVPQYLNIQESFLQIAEIELGLFYLYVACFLFFIIWTLFMVFFLQAQIQKNSKTIQFRHWYFSLIFGFFYIQYHVNDEQKFHTKNEELHKNKSNNPELNTNNSNSEEAPEL